MDSFLRLYKIYYSLNAWAVLKPVYFDSLNNARIRLWLSVLIVLAVGSAIVVFQPAVWATVPFAIVTWSCISLHFRVTAQTYVRFYSTYSDRLRFYGKDYQYLRYCLFKEHLAGGGYSGDIADALSHVEVELQTETSSPVSTHPFFAGSIALLIGVVSSSAGAWNAELTVLTVAWLFVIAVFTYMILSLSRTPGSRLKEFRRFLLWLQADEKRPLQFVG